MNSDDFKSLSDPEKDAAVERMLACFDMRPTGVLPPVVDPEFEALIFPQTPAEADTMEANLLADGCREPLSVWKGSNILLDGHHRFRICKKHRLPYKVVYVELASREAARSWIVANQCGRRNLSIAQRVMLMRRLEGAVEDAPVETPVVSPEAVVPPVVRKPFITVSKESALTDVSPSTIKRTKRIMAEGSPELFKAVEDKKVSITAAVRVLGLPKEDQLKAALESKPVRKTVKAVVMEADVYDKVVGMVMSVSEGRVELLGRLKVWVDAELDKSDQGLQKTS